MVAGPFWTFYKISNDGKRREVVQPKLIITTFNPAVKYKIIFDVSPNILISLISSQRFRESLAFTNSKLTFASFRVNHTRTRAAGKVFSVKDFEN